ncbi:recombinase [Priestia megaterium]|nr:recombinase [Priestia megaterium]
MIQKVAIYLRLSRDEENKGVEMVLSHHRTKLIQLCRQNNWSYDVYQEIASSYTILRKQLTLLFDKVQEKEYDAVVVMDIDRLSRNDYDASVLFRSLMESNTLIVTPEKTYDWKNDGDDLLLKIQSIVASQEYKQIKKRMQQGKRYAAEKGHWVNGIPPFGYKKDHATRKLVPTDNAKHVSFIFHAIASGETIPRVCKKLNDLGVKTNQHRSFTYAAVRRILTNAVYKGDIVSNRYRDKSTYKPQDEWVHAKQVHEAIVDEKTWNKANEMLETYSFSAPRSKNKIYPTTKLIVCGNCGKFQGPQLAHTGKVYLKICPGCKNRSFLYEPVLRKVKEEVRRHIPSIIARIEDIPKNEQYNTFNYQKEQLLKKIQTSELAVERLLPLYEEGLIELKKYKERKNARTQDIQTLTQQLQKLEEKQIKSVSFDKRMLQEYAQQLTQNWNCLDENGLSDEEVNRLLHFLIKRIEWTYSKEKDCIPSLRVIYK